MADARTETVKLLGKTFSKGGYSNILLDKTLEKSALDEADKNFVRHCITVSSKER